MDLNNPNIPILGQKRADEPNAPGLTAACEIHDSEVIEIEHVTTILNEKARGRRQSYADFQREIIQRFQDIGFVATVGWWTASTEDGAVIPGMLIPEITLKDRIERGEFDHDRKVHEITNDILELGDKGVVKSGDFTPPEHNHNH